MLEVQEVLYKSFKIWLRELYKDASLWKKWLKYLREVSIIVDSLWKNIEENWSVWRTKTLVRKILVTPKIFRHFSQLLGKIIKDLFLEMRLCEKLLWKMNRGVLNFYWHVINKIFIPWHELKIMSTMWTEFCHYKQKEIFLKIAYYNKWAIASWFLTAISSAKRLSLDLNFFQDVMMWQKPGCHSITLLEISYYLHIYTSMSSTQSLSLDSNSFQDVMMRQKSGYYCISKLEISHPQFQNCLNRKTRFSLRLVFLWVWIVLPEENKIIGLK